MKIILAWAGLAAMTLVAAPAFAQASRPTAAPTVRAPDKAAADAAARRAARIDRMFRAADRNRDNAISRGEYLNWYKAAARRRSPLTWKTHAADSFRKLDVEKKGRLTRAEFAADPFFRRTRPGWARGQLNPDAAEAKADDASIRTLETTSAPQ